MEMYMGRPVLETLFDTMREDRKTTSVFLSFPEQWLNIIEQRQIYDRCRLYLPNLQRIQIKTHSVYIVQVTYASDIFMFDDLLDKEEGLSDGDCQNRLDRKLYTENAGDVFSAKGITVL
jgi:hypothetical protein